MKTLGNILWHIPFLGFLSAFTTFIFGCILAITIIGAPIGLGLIQLSKFLLTPFSMEMVSKKDLQVKQNNLWYFFSVIIRIIYFPFGLILSVITIFQIVGLFMSIVGIPVALVLAKSLGTFFNPVNKVCVPQTMANEIYQQKAQKQIKYYSQR